MKQLVVAVFALTLVIAPSCEFLKSKGIIGRKARALAEEQARQDSIRVADSIRLAQEQLQAIENARLDSLRLSEEAKALAMKNRYNIIVGSFITPEYARGHEEYYRQQGYNPQIIKLEGTNFELVAAETHENFSEAVTRLSQFQDTVEIDAWLYIRQ